jgi:hypothetical protein
MDSDINFDIHEYHSYKWEDSRTVKKREQTPKAKVSHETELQGKKY